MTPLPKSPEIAGILLAAGSSRRFGSANKLLATVDGKALVRRAAEAMIASRAGTLIVVTGHEAEQVRSALAGLPVRFVHNYKHLEGIGASIATGVATMKPTIEGVLIAQADMPWLDVAVIDALIARFHASGRGRIVVPVDLDGAQGNPVLWPRRLFADLAALTGDAGGKATIKREGAAAEQLLVEDARLFSDVDTQSDLAAVAAQSPLKS